MPGATVLITVPPRARLQQIPHAATLLALRLRGPGFLFVLLLLCGFCLFGIVLSVLFSLVFLAFFVAHGVTPFLCRMSLFAASVTSGLCTPNLFRANTEVICGGQSVKSLTVVEPQFVFTDAIPFLAAPSDEYIWLVPMTC